MADAPMLRQVWINLISNAIKYSSYSSSPEIIISCYSTENEYVFLVRDNGVGFDKAYSSKLFKVFQRLHSTRQFEGSGVGLAIVEKIVGRHDGRVWADGEVDKGATFYFSIPK
jgi:two-component system, sensor histidine kinase and response regulator